MMKMQNKPIIELYRGCLLGLAVGDALGTTLEIQGSDVVVKSLEAALWAFYNSATFEEGCLLAVNLGDDADTTGAYYGDKTIPLLWKKQSINMISLSLLPKKWRMSKINNFPRHLSYAAKQKAILEEDALTHEYRDIG